MNMNVLQSNIIEWAKKREIFEKSSPAKQNEKTTEEAGEIKDAIDDLIDALGDTQVTLILQCEMQGINWLEVVGGAQDHCIALNHACSSLSLSDHYEVIKSRVSMVEEYRDDDALCNYYLLIVDIQARINMICEKIGETPEHCLETAYNVIKGRTGKMVNGLYVKDE